jgi:transposase-like protein
MAWSGDAMTKADQVRLTTWRFKVLRQAEERARNVAQTCRHFGISRKTFYKWKRRFADHGEAGLCDRARTPHRSPHATPPEVVSKLRRRPFWCIRHRRLTDHNLTKTQKCSKILQFTLNAGQGSWSQKPATSWTVTLACFFPAARGPTWM